MAQDISNGKQEQRVLQGGKIEGTARSLSVHVHRWARCASHQQKCPGGRHRERQSFMAQQSTAVSSTSSSAALPQAPHRRLATPTHQSHESRTH
jgi:hypothetical protein